MLLKGYVSEMKAEGFLLRSSSKLELALSLLLALLFIRHVDAATVMFDNTAGATSSLTAAAVGSSFYTIDDANHFFAFTFAEPDFATSPYTWAAATFKVGLWRTTSDKSRAFYLEQRCLASAPPAGLPGTLLASQKTSLSNVDLAPGYQSLSTCEPF
jgi:hypothetical protein